jgi:hypothetical protein
MSLDTLIAKSSYGNAETSYFANQILLDKGKSTLKSWLWLKMQMLFRRIYPKTRRISTK